MEPQAIRAQVGALLGAREALIWVGQPWQGLRLYRNDLFFVPASLWSALLIGGFGAVLVNGWQLPIALVGVVLLAAALYAVIGRFFMDAYLRAHTFYALTNRRIIIHRTGLLPRTTSYDVRTLPDVTIDIRGNDRGTIVLGEAYGFPDARAMPSPGGEKPTPILDHIANAAQVYDMIEALRDDPLER